MLNDSKSLKKDLSQQSAIFKSKFLNDKDTKIKIEDELTKILLKETEDARTLNLTQACKISELETEIFVLKNRLLNVKNKQTNIRNERNEFATQLKNERAQVIKLDKYSFKLKIQLDEVS